MSSFGIAGGGLLVLLGLVWVGQGLGYIKGSFMTGAPFWAAMGVVCVLAGAFVIWRSLRARHRAA